MINLGFSTAGLFFIAGFLYSRQQTTHLSAFGGMAKQVPLLATFFLIIGLASIGLPGTNGFVGEFLILLGAFKAKWWYGAVAVLGVIFGAAYFLWYYERAMLGPLGKAVKETMNDLQLREITIAAVLVGHDSVDRPLSGSLPAHYEWIGASAGRPVGSRDGGGAGPSSRETRTLTTWVSTRCSISCLLRSSARSR